MKLQVPVSSSNNKFSSGFTLVEMMVALGVGVVVIGVISCVTIFTAQNFLATTNYVDMDNQSRNALDNISRNVRNSSALLGFSTNNPQYLLLTNALAGTSSTITYDANAGTLTLAKSGEAKRTLLAHCDFFTFQLYNRFPDSGNLSFYRSTNAVNGQLDAQFCKVINLTWRCYRTIRGSKLNTEIVQTAQVVLRNQVYK